MKVRSEGVGEGVDQSVGVVDGHGDGERGGTSKVLEYLLHYFHSNSMRQRLATIAPYRGGLPGQVASTVHASVDPIHPRSVALAIAAPLPPGLRE
jgi:hypothetical protein